MENKKVKSYLLAIFFIIVGIVCDQYSKWLATVHLKEQEPFIVIKDVFQLFYLENRGAAFGIMQNRQIFFIVGAAVILLAMAYVYGKIPLSAKYFPLRVCVVLVCSGAVGNLIDRLRLNYVVDFFYFELIDFPVFNVADIYVVAACFLFAFLILFYYKEEELNFLSLKKKAEDE